MLKTPETKIEYQNNAKKPGSKAWERYEKYKGAKTVGETQALGAKWEDLTGDFENKYLKITELKENEHSSSAKRAAPIGTPDREAMARSKQPSTEVQPLGMGSEMEMETAKVETNHATIQALRMMREEIANGMGEMEHRLVTKINETTRDLKNEW